MHCPRTHQVLPIIFLTFLTGCGPDPVGTLESMVANSAALRESFNQQSAKISQGLSKDCITFDGKHTCLSFTGTRSNSKDGLDDTTGTLTLAHQPSTHLRVGGYIGQSFNSSELGGLRVKHSKPGYGAFAVWSAMPSGTGIQIRGSISFARVAIDSIRSTIDYSQADSPPAELAESGFGRSQIKSDGFQLEVSRGYALTQSWVARPYAGYKQMHHLRSDYTETDAVNRPLTYSSIEQKTQTLTAGAHFGYNITEQTTITGTIGLEHDTKNNVDRYAVTGRFTNVIESIDMELRRDDTRPSFTLGLTHSIDKAQRIGVSLMHRKEALDSGSTTSGTVQYSRGF